VRGVQGACPWPALTGTGDMAEGSECCATSAGLNLMVQIKNIHQDWDEKCAPELGLKMCTKAGFRDVYQNWD
jgi:hypothetical protein